MRLLEIRRQVPRGALAGDAWLVFATFAVATGWVLFFHLPLFALRWSYDAGRDVKRYGWHVPVIGFRYDKNDWWTVKILVDWRFHSPLMGELKEERL